MKEYNLVTEAPVTPLPPEPKLSNYIIAPENPWAHVSHANYGRDGTHCL